MSFLAEAWADAQKPRTGGQLHLLRIIASHFRDEEGYAWPSNRYLASKTLVSEATVERNLTALEEQGYLRRETKTWGPNGGAKRHIYLNFDAEVVEEGLRMKRARPTRRRPNDAPIRSPQFEGTCRAEPEPNRSPHFEGQVPSFCGPGPLTGEGTESLGNPLGDSSPPKPPEDGGTSALPESDLGSKMGAALPPPDPSAQESARRGQRLGRAARHAPVHVLAPEAAARFRELVAVFPQDGTLGSREFDAQTAFAALSPEQQRVAIDRARAYADLRRRKPGHVFALQTWLRQTDFSQPAAAAAAPAAPPQRVFVRDGSPEWDAWAAHYRRLGKPMPTPIRSELNRADGWNFPAATPAAISAAA
ncbi:helix-turn-helix domain-containing protein [Methylobacterium brachiatum]|uniref:helix-turn-helix domain-containing protein n=1 Tax=Methylobacterium brachiatum TaxID=269660 RepID=UPI002449F33A|nr:helix-turn-helix domain-containing protein [Methylobacterium brachiatum]MDH2313116.1 helix-turn-helix domain-containing protein [Methylobacterium brachiatum]